VQYDTIYVESIVEFWQSANQPIHGEAYMNFVGNNFFNKLTC